MTYNGRRGPNVSQYLRDLNTIGPQEPGAPHEENFTMEDDLALFTNTQFFDFDSGQNTDYQARPRKPEVDASRTPGAASEDVSAATSVMGDIPNLDFMTGEFNFADFSSTYPTPAMNAFADGTPSFHPMPGHHGPSPVYSNHVSPQPQQLHHNAGRVVDKRKGEAVKAPAVTSPHVNFEDSSRHAAEEDKRRRNTAASARFRVKKKQREQALEKSAKEMVEKVTSLESKVSQLETENKWLKNLLVEKNEGNENITTMWKEFTKHATEKSKASTGKASGKAER